MNTKKTIRKILFIGIWLMIGTGMLMLLIAAIGKQRKDTCKDYAIVIKGNESDELFLEKSDILKLLKAATHGNIKGQSKKAFDLPQMEQLLEDNVWVKEARIYFDNKEVLHVSVTERTPVARIFTVGGRSFYMDEMGQTLQLSDKRSANVPVFTGYPDKKKSNKADSVLTHDVIALSTFVSTHPFWNSQVAQVDLVPAGTNGFEFEMIPLIGTHTVKLGDGNELDAKFARLFIFYKQVLSKSGFDKYKTIDVRYAGQVVAAKSLTPKVDADLLKKSVDKLLQQIKDAEAANDAANANVNYNSGTTNAASSVLQDGEAQAKMESEIKPERPAEKESGKPMPEAERKAEKESVKPKTNAERPAEKEGGKQAPKAEMQKKH